MLNQLNQSDAVVVAQIARPVGNEMAQVSKVNIHSITSTLTTDSDQPGIPAWYTTPNSIHRQLFIFFLRYVSDKPPQSTPSHSPGIITSELTAKPTCEFASDNERGS